MQAPCVNTIYVKNVADVLFTAIPFPARYPPVPIKDIITHLSISVGGNTIEFLVHEGDIGEVEGFLKAGKKGNKKYFAIAINKKNPRVRRRWTMAHELAHALLLHPFQPKKSRWLKDREADKLAREILIPRDFLCKNFEPRQLHNKVFGGLAGRYWVSQDSMDWALKEYGLVPGLERCVHFPDTLECVSSIHRKHCPKEAPPIECKRCVLDTSVKVKIRCKPFVLNNHYAFTFFGINDLEDLLEKAPIARLLERI